METTKQTWPFPTFGSKPTVYSYQLVLCLNGWDHFVKRCLLVKRRCFTTQSIDHFSFVHLLLHFSGAEGSSWYCSPCIPFAPLFYAHELHVPANLHLQIACWDMAHARKMRCSSVAQSRKCLTYFINSFAVRLRLHLATRFNHDAWIGCILATHPIPLAHAWMENPSLSLDIWKKVDVMGGLAGILTIITK